MGYTVQYICDRKTVGPVPSDDKAKNMANSVPVQDIHQTAAARLLCKPAQCVHNSIQFSFGSAGQSAASDVLSSEEMYYPPQESKDYY